MFRICSSRLLCSELTILLDHDERLLMEIVVCEYDDRLPRRFMTLCLTIDILPNNIKVGMYVHKSYIPRQCVLL